MLDLALQDFVRTAQAMGLPKTSSYKLEGETKFKGLDIAIENKKGSIRKWFDPHGKEAGRTTMHFAYGYIRLTKGTDGDHVDVYLGPDEDSDRVFLVNQMKKPDFKTFDEQKIMLGFKDADAAKAAYLKQYDDPKFFGSMKEMGFEDFKTKVLDKANHGKKIAAKLHTPEGVFGGAAADSKVGFPEANQMYNLEAESQDWATGVAQRGKLLAPAPADQQKTAVSADWIRTHVAQGAAKRGRPMGRKQQAELANAAVQYAKAKSVRSTPGLIPHGSKNPKADTKTTRGKLKSIIEKMKKTKADTRPPAGGPRKYRGMSPNDKVTAVLIGGGIGVHAQGAAESVRRHGEEKKLKREKRELRKAKTAADSGPSKVEKGVRYTGAGASGAYSGGLLGGVAGVAASRLRHKGSILPKYLSRGVAIGAGLGAGLGLKEQHGHFEKVDKTRKEVSKLKREVKTMKTKKSDAERRNKIESRVEDAGIATLAAPYAAHLAGKAISKIPGRVGQLGSKIVEHAGTESAFGHSRVRELAGLAAVAPGIGHRIAKSVDAKLPETKTSAAIPVAAVKSVAGRAASGAMQVAARDAAAVEGAAARIKPALPPRGAVASTTPIRRGAPGSAPPAPAPAAAGAAQAQPVMAAPMPPPRPLIKPGTIAKAGLVGAGGLALYGGYKAVGAVGDLASARPAAASFSPTPGTGRPY